jgi:hypothetical protein
MPQREQEPVIGLCSTKATNKGTKTPTNFPFINQMVDKTHRGSGDPTQPQNTFFPRNQPQNNPDQPLIYDEKRSGNP